MKKLFCSLAIVLAAFAATPAQAALVPYGVHNDVEAATVTGDWGFTQCYAGLYNSPAVISTVLAGCQGDYLMLAARRVGSSQFEVLAAADYADVIFDTGASNITHAANGVEWYFGSNSSWGFAGAGDRVHRVACDVNGSSHVQQAPERDRLCWHTNNGRLTAGWRAGSEIWLNDSTAWERVILVGNAPQDAGELPEPAGLALAGTALLGLALVRRRKT